METLEQEIGVTVDPATLLNAMAATFTRSTTVVSELLQNGRRAGATRIEIRCEGDRLEVIDDGIGIENFAVLFALAKSGWSAEVKDAESPYGLGFLSSIFSCERLEIRSRGRCFIESTENLRQLGRARPQPCEDDGLTRIVLEGFVAAGEAALRIRNMVQGFPIPVVFNGVELDRPHRPDQEGGVDIGIGMYFAQHLADVPPITYLQGLPIQAVDRGVYGHSGYERPVLHLDPRQVFGRMPDRDRVREPEKTGAAITEAIRRYCRGALEELQRSRSHEDFMRKHSRECLEWRFIDILNKCDLVPGHWLQRYTSRPVHAYDGGDTGKEPIREEWVHRADLERDPPVAMVDEWEEDGDATAEVFAYKRGFRILSRRVPSKHWLSAIAVALGPDAIQRTPQGAAEPTPFEGEDFSLQLRLVKGLTLTHPTLGSVDLDLDDGLYDGETLWVMPTAGGDLIQQYSAFTDENGDEDEDLRLRAEADLDVRLNELRGGSPEVALNTYLERGLPYTLPDCLDGTRFELSFKRGANGQLQFALTQLPF